MTQARRLDYDTLANTYNRRFDNQADRGVGIAVRDLAARLEASRVLEVACGTGHWLVSLRPSLEDPAQQWGLDYSAGMLAQAQAHEGLLLVRGRAEDLPLVSTAFDLVYCVNAIHHFTDGSRFIHQARRLLRPGGALAVAGMNPHNGLNQWYIYDYFAGAEQADRERFPTWGTVLDWMIAAGFERVELKTVEVIVNSYAGAAVLDDPFLEKHACSQLAMLSDQEYRAGLHAIRQALALAGQRGENLNFKNEIHIDMLTGITS